MTQDDLNDEIELLRKSTKLMREQINDHGDASGETAKQIEKFNGKIKELQKSIKAKEISESFDMLNKKLKSGGTDVNDLANEFKRLNDAAADHGVVLDKATKAQATEVRNTIRNQAIAKGSLDAAENAVKTYVMNYIENMKAVVGSVSSASNAFDMAASVQKLNIDLTKREASGFADALGTSAVAVGALFGPQGMLAGAVIAGAAQMFKGINEARAELLKFGVDVVNEQTKRMVDSFMTVTKAGALFADGADGLANISNQAGISIKQMSQVIAENNRALVQFGGTVGNGAVKLGKVFTAFSDGQKRNLMNLGISVEQQMSTTADYLELLNRSGDKRKLNDEQLANESYKYMLNLKTISQLTGEEAKAAQARAKSAASQSFVNAKLNDLGGDAMKKFQLAIAGMDPVFQSAAQQMLTFNGAIVDPELAAAFAQMPAGYEFLKKLIGGIEDSTQNVDSFTKDIGKFRKELGGAKDQFMAGGKIFGMLEVAGKGYGTASKVAAALQKAASSATGESADAMGNAADLTNKAAETTSELTNALSDAQVQFNLLATDLEKTLRPAILNFAKFAEQQMADSKKYIDKMLILMGIKVGEEAEAPGRKDKKLTTTVNAAANDVKNGKVGYEEAEAILKNGSEKDIAAFGGREVLENILKNTTPKPQEKPKPYVAPTVNESQSSIATKQLLAASDERARQREARGAQVAPATINPTYAPGVKPNDSAVSLSPDVANDTDPIIKEIMKRRKDVDAMANKRDSEGIAYGPTMTGEAGPEAHIKLRNNSVPLDINFGPLIAAFNEQTKLTQEVIDELRNSKDIQERLLNASY